jgi:hypothetical protein
MLDVLNLILGKCEDLEVLKSCLSNLDSLEFLGLTEAKKIQARVVWEKALLHCKHPKNLILTDERIVSAHDDDRFSVLMGILREFNVETNFFLSLGYLGILPWAEIRISNTERWLVELYEKDYEDFAVLAKDLSVAICAVNKLDIYAYEVSVFKVSNELYF